MTNNQSQIKEGDRCYLPAFGDRPCRVRGFNVPQAMAKFGYDIIVEIDKGVAGAHGGYFNCKSKEVFRDPKDAILRWQQLVNLPKSTE